MALGQSLKDPAGHLAPQVDGLLLVIRAGRVTRPQSQRARAALEAVQARVLGVVVNDVKAQAGSEGYYYYGEKR